MALDLGELYIRISVQTKQLKVAEREVETFEKKTRDSLKSVERETKSTSASFGLLKGAIAGYISVETLRRTVMFTDHMRGLELQIKDMTRTTGDFEGVRKGLVGITMETGAALDANVALAQNVGRAARDMGKSNEQVLQFIENTNKAAIIGGASATEMKFAMRQLSQAMAGTNVRAEEFNSILENTPGLAAEIAEGMGMTVTGMRAMMLQGKLSSEAVFDSILSRTDELNDKFEEMPVRFGQGLEKMKAGWGRFMMAVGGTDDPIAMTMDQIGRQLDEYAAKLENQNKPTFLKNLEKDAIDSGAELRKFIDDFSKIDLVIRSATKGVDSTNKIIVGYNQELSKMSDELFNAAKAYEAIANASNRFSKGEISADKLNNIIAENRELASQLDLLMQGESVHKAQREEISAAQKEYEKNFAIAADLYDTKLQTLETQREATQAAIEANFAGKEEESILRSVLGLLDQQIAKIHEKNAAASEMGMADKDLEGIMRSLETSEERINRVYKDRAEAIKENKMLQEGLAAGVTTDSLLEKNEKQRQAELTKTVVKGAKSRVQAVSNVESEFYAMRESLYTGVEKEEARYAKSKDILENAFREEVILIEEFNEIKEVLERDHMAAMQMVQGEGHKSMTQKELELFQTKKEIQAQTVGLYAQSLGEMNDMLVAAGREGTAIQKGIFLANKALIVAEIIMNAHLAAAKIQAAMPGIGGPLAIATLAQGYASAGMVAGMAVADVAGKATGGDVSQFNAYRVNEQGTEMLTQGGQDYLLMGSQKGHITPAHEVGSGGSQPVIKIINMTGTAVQQSGTRVNSQGEVEIIIRQAVERSMGEFERRMDVGGNPTSDSLDRNYNVRRGVS